jgi:hypothetical protein
MADRRARAVMSRDRRWKQRSGSGMIGKVLAVLATIGIAGALWVAFKPGTTPSAPPLAFPQFVAEVETAFPEALSGYTRAHGGQLLDGRDVPVSVRLLLPSNALRSAGAAPDALTRLSAPFVGAERAISGKEMGARIARLAALALPAGVSSCYMYSAGMSKGITTSDNRKLRVTPLDIMFIPEC